MWDPVKMIKDDQNFQILQCCCRIVHVAILSRANFLCLPSQKFKNKTPKKWELWKFRSSHHDRQRCLTWKQGRCSIHIALLIVYYTINFCFVFSLFCSSNTNDQWLLLMLENYLVKSFCRYVCLHIYGHNQELRVTKP